MIDEQAWRLVPERKPEDTPLWVEAALSARPEHEREGRAYAWADRLLRRLSEENGLEVVRNSLGAGESALLDVSAGFIPFGNAGANGAFGARGRFFERNARVARVVTESGSYAFGVVVGVAGDVADGVELEIDGFPVVVERRRVELAAPPNPVGGAMSSCFAKPLAGKRYRSGVVWTDGVIVARHSLGGAAVGTGVTMDDGTVWSVADVDAATTIDAAILERTGGVPSAVSVLTHAAATLVGVTVDVQTSATFSASVLRVMEDPSYFGNMVAHRVFIDRSGVSGDSGALAVEASSSEAVGIYIGNTGGSGTTEGLLQSMRQVCKYFDVELVG